MKHSLKYYTLFFICTLIPSILFAKPNTQSPDFHLEYLVDEQGTLTFDDISSQKPAAGRLSWTKSKTGTRSFGFTSAAIWVRFSITNNSNQDKHFYLQESTPLLDELLIYINSPGMETRIIKTGDQVRNSHKRVSHRTYIFPVTHKAQSEQWYYLRYKTFFPMAFNLSFITPEELQQLKDYGNPILWLYYGILLVMVVFTLLIFISIRDISYLYHSLYIATMSFVLMMLNGTVSQYLAPGLGAWKYPAIFFLTGLNLSVAIYFARKFINLPKMAPKHDYVLRKIAIFFIAWTILALVIPAPFIHTVTLYIMVGIMALLMSIEMTYLLVVYRSRQLIFLFTAFIFLTIGSILKVLTSLSFIPDNFITANGLYIGSILQIIILSTGLIDKIKYMERKLEKTEQKYRHLVEDSGDIIFSLDENLNFLTVNKAVKKHLGYKAGDIVDKNFLDLIHRTLSENNNINERIVEEYIFELLENKSSVSFRTNLKSRYNPEPKELIIKLEYTHFGKKIDILGKASPITEDILIQLLDAEKQTYQVNNYLSNIPLLIQRLTLNLDKYLNSRGITELRIALREIMINAIEHGSLDLRFEEKTKALMESNYLQFLYERQKNPRYSNKKITIEYSLNPRMAAYRISDEGDGFDHENIVASILDTANTERYAHGRGLAIALKAFDTVKFNEKGNQVLLVKYFTETKETTTKPLFITKITKESA
ncbi:MAG: PAS domain S-box protein [bacterium]|nr:PAS domain S-box protein [bacterium]